MKQELPELGRGLHRVTTRFALVFSFLSVVSAGRADIAWKGIISEGAKSQFALTDTATGASKWVRVGGAFETYSVSHYDDQKQVLTLTRGSSTVQLSMSSSQYTPPPTAPTAESTEDLRTMNDFRLAQTLADRGDVTLQALLSERRDLSLNLGDVSRTLAAAERKIRANAPDAPSPVAIKSYREDLQRWNDEIARVEGEIHATVAARRQTLPSGK